jgi:hypothetical protein
MFKGWQKRWFVFSASGEVAYYTDEKEVKKKAESLHLRECAWITSNHIEAAHFELHFASGKTTELRFPDKVRRTAHPHD